MFGKLKNLFGSGGACEIASPLSGKITPIEQVPDPTFAQGILGKGVAILPAEGKIFAPANGTIEVMFDTGHAVSMTTEQGVEVLIHIGVDTVRLAGKHYKACCKAGDKVKKGDLLIEFDPEAIRAEGYENITPVVITNSDNFAHVKCEKSGDIVAGDTLLSLETK